MEIHLNHSRTSESLASRVIVSRVLKSSNIEQLLREVEGLQQQGFRYAALRRQQAHRIGREKIRHVLDDAGIRVSSYGYCGGFTGTLGMSFDEAMEDTSRAVDEAIELGARSLIVLPGARGVHTWKHSLKSIRIGLQSAISHAGAAQLKLLVPTSEIIASDRDKITVPGSAVQWLRENTSSRIQPLLLVRGRGRQRTLPRGWKKSLLGGASLRLCNRSETFFWNQRLLTRVLSVFSSQELGQTPAAQDEWTADERD